VDFKSVVRQECDHIKIESISVSCECCNENWNYAKCRRLL